MRTLQEMRALVDEGKAQVLTIERAKELKGKAISTIYFGYQGQDGIDHFVVGDVVSKLEYYRNLKEDCYPDKHGFQNRAEYWEAIMTEEELEECRRNNILITAEGRNTYIQETGSGVFWCSDQDRHVFYIEEV